MHHISSFQAILAGDYILGISTQALARIRNEQVITILSQVIEDLVRGMLLGISFVLPSNQFQYLSAQQIKLME